MPRHRVGVTVANTDTLHFLQAYWWTSGGQTFVGTQVATTATDDPDVQITVTWRTADGQTGSYPLQRFVDDNEYQYHFANPQPVPAKPVAADRDVQPRRHDQRDARRVAGCPAAATPDGLPEGLHQRVHDARGRAGSHQAAGPAVPEPRRRHQPAEQDAGLPAHRRRPTWATRPPPR